MVGAIGKRDILAHPWVTVRCFGWRVFLRALVARRDTTFLSLLTDSEVLKPAGEGVPEFVARCVELELKASRIYSALARRFADQPGIRDFLAALSVEEDIHAELLELAETAASRERWDESQVARWREVIPELEREMEAAEGAVDEIHSPREALQRVIDIESSEINDVFAGVMAASDSAFVRRLHAFHQVEVRHLHFIGERIAQLEPDLGAAGRSLQRRFPRTIHRTAV